MVGVLALSAAVLAGTAGCVWGGDRKVSEQKELQQDIALQRESALRFRDRYEPNVEKIRFKHEGDVPGLGASWSVNAVATIGGIDYQVIISPTLGPGWVGDEGEPPELPDPPSRLPLTLIFSDGTSEVVE
jgi:hypothetical protein